MSTTGPPRRLWLRIVDVLRDHDLLDHRHRDDDALHVAARLHSVADLALDTGADAVAVVADQIDREALGMAGEPDVRSAAQAIVDLVVEYWQGTGGEG